MSELIRKHKPYEINVFAIIIDLTYVTTYGITLKFCFQIQQIKMKVSNFYDIVPIRNYKELSKPFFYL